MTTRIKDWLAALGALLMAVFAFYFAGRCKRLREWGKGVR